MRYFEQFFCPRSRTMECCPTDPGFEERVDKPNLHQVKKSQREVVIDGFPLPLPQRRQRPGPLVAMIAISSQPAAHAAGGNPCETGSIRDGVNPSVEVTGIHRRAAHD